MKINEKYTHKTTAIETQKGCWNVLKVEIYLNKDDGTQEKIGEYIRNYSSMYDTFVPFVQNGKEYALYSSDYTATRVMSLPSCEDVCGEERNAFGFCPVGYYVPEEGKGKIGFVSGCVWGDDCSWKIQYLDLSNIENGVLKRDARFGYLELMPSYDLKQAIDMEDYDDTEDEDGDRHRRIWIASSQQYDLDDLDEAEKIKNSEQENNDGKENN